MRPERARHGPADADARVVPPPPTVAVVVVTYNSADVLADCLGSLRAGCRGVRCAAVVVADNSSRDESVRIARRIPELPLRVLQLGRNAGYAAAINAAVHTLDLDELDAVLVLNPDAQLRPGAVATLASALREPGRGEPGRGEPGRGIAVPLLLNPDGTLQPSLRWAPTVLRALAESVIGGTLASRHSLLGELITDPERYRRPGPAVWATGAAMLLSTALIRDIGDWDESFLLYGEEVDYALRAADRGWVLWYEPAAVVEHIGGESGTNPMLAALLTVNRVALFRRRRGPLPGAAYYTATLLGSLIRAAAGSMTARAAVVALVRPSRRLHQLPG